MESVSSEPPHVLLADDDAVSRKLLTTRLQGSGYQVTEVASGEEVLQALQGDSFDLLLLDVMMQGIDGFATLEQVRQVYGNSDLPVIMLTSLDGAGDVIQALRLGANDYAVKPVDFEQLTARMQTHVGLKMGRRRLGKYELIDTLGSGAVGVVYAARDSISGRDVALKVLGRAVTIQRDTLRRFLQEAALMAKVQHPNVVRLYDTGQDSECYFLAMERVYGRTLEDAAKPTPLTPSRAVSLTMQVAQGLLALHEAGIVHRDIKPQNIMMTPDGVAKITDFGIAFDLTEKNRLTQAGVGVGSLLYASPQQLLGQPDVRSDMYALGATLYFLLTGVPPFSEALPMPELFAAKFAPPPDPRAVQAAVPESVSQIVMQLMAPVPKNRFPNDDVLVRTLQKLNTELI